MPNNIDGRHFAPHARYAANNDKGVRWHDPETGQEHLSLPVTRERFADAGATLTELADGPIVDRVEIGPYQPPEPEWLVEIDYAELRARESSEGRLRIITTENAVESRTFEDRKDAVEFAESRVAAFEDAERRDAREKRLSD